MALRAPRNPIYLLVAILYLGATAGLPGMATADEPSKTAEADRIGGVKVIERGEALGDSPLADLAAVMDSPAKAPSESVILEARILEVCPKKGCWMTVGTEGSEGTMRVTFHDYGFFVPLDSQGMLVRMEGIVETRTLSKADADHLEAEGAHLVRNADGTATELGFTATGVELSPAPEEKPTPARESE